jgi:hypothetical protein
MKCSAMHPAGICRRSMRSTLEEVLTCDLEDNKLGDQSFGQGLSESFDAAARKRNVDSGYTVPLRALTCSDLLSPNLVSLQDLGSSPRAGILSTKALFHSLKASPRGSSRRRPHVEAPPVKRASPRAFLDPLGGYAPRGVLGSRRRPSYRHSMPCR